jgi:hypothetical protein
MGLPCTVRHVLNGGVEGKYTTVLMSALPQVVNPPRAVLLHKGVVMLEGLFPSCFLGARIYAPSYKMASRWVVHGLTLGEHLGLHQMPLDIDPLVAYWNTCKQLPFKDSPPLEVYTSVFCQLWGSGGGGLGVGDVSHPMHNEDAIAISLMPLPCGDIMAGPLSEALVKNDREMTAVTWPNTLSHSAATKGTGAWQIKLDMERDVDGSQRGSGLTDEDTVMSSTSTRAGDTTAGSLSKMPGTDDREMTAIVRPDTLSHSAAMKGTSAWKFKLDMERDVEGSQMGSWLTDEDTVTSSTSTNTLLLAPANTVCRGWRTGDPILLEDHEIAPPPRFNPGSPFAVGEVIMCDVPGHPRGVHYIPGHPHGVPNGLRRGFFVLQSKHPRYQIHLESGQTVWTHTGESWLCPCYAPGEFAEDQDNPFADLRTDILLEFCSYGLHMNAQQEILEKVLTPRLLLQRRSRQMMWKSLFTFGMKG